MNSEESMNIEIKLELHEEVTFDDNGGEQMEALFSNETVKLENEVKTELPDEVFANEIDDNPKYFCELCNSYFPSPSSLQDHITSHDSCDGKTKDSLNFEETLNTEVKVASVKENQREKPDDKQKEKCNKKKAKRKRKRLSTYCNVCRKKYSSREYLNEHVKRIHLGIRLECKFCDKSYKHKTSFRRHTKLHLGIKMEYL